MIVHPYIVSSGRGCDPTIDDRAGTCLPKTANSRYVLQGDRSVEIWSRLQQKVGCRKGKSFYAIADTDAPPGRWLVMLAIFNCSESDQLMAEGPCRPFVPSLNERRHAERNADSGGER